MKGIYKMSVSVLTRKGQTTIPKEIRKFLNIGPRDKILYIVEGDRVILKPLKGNILELRGSVSRKGKSSDFEGIRGETRRRMTRRKVERTT